MIHHVAMASDWDAAEPTGVFDRSTLNASIDEVGFLHASDSYEQASRVVRYLFGDVDGEMVLLDLDPEVLAGHGLRVVHECASPQDPASEKFPHVYGGPIPVEVIGQVQRFGSRDELLAALDRGEGADPASPA